MPRSPADLENAHALVAQIADTGLHRRLHRTAAETGAAITGPRKPGIDALTDHLAFELRGYPQDN